MGTTFAAAALTEDNLLLQVKKKGGKVVRKIVFGQTSLLVSDLESLLHDSLIFTQETHIYYGL